MASSPYFHESACAPFRAEALASIALLLFAFPKPARNFVFVLLGTAFVVLGNLWLRHFQPTLNVVLADIGLASLVALGLLAISAKNHDRRRLLSVFFGAALFAASDWAITLALYATTRLHPKTFDLFLFSFDASLGFQPSFVAGQWMAGCPWLHAICMAVYIGLPIPLMLLFVTHLRRRDSLASSVLVPLLAAPILGTVIYNLLPATGPAYVFGGFPQHPLAMETVRTLAIQPLPIPAAPRNAMPSLHMAWVLLALWRSRQNTALQWIFLAFAIFTVAATLGSGEHYLIDLVVAFPFALMVHAGCDSTIPWASLQRKVPILFGTFAVLLWIALLSFVNRVFWLSPAIPWCLASLTVLGSCAMAGRFGFRLHPSAGSRYGLSVRNRLAGAAIPELLPAEAAAPAPLPR
ncbi:MAG: phosphatase PAP2 family protein [Acidobacteria bacterium]|nr:phosphatase PAP2 family protein [Acidobacteriota bacterium]